MDILVGLVLPLVVGISATWIGLDRDRALYPATMIFIAGLYVLFAVMGGSRQALVAEIAVGAAFIAAAVAGFRWTLWIVVGALAAHGLMDLVHGHFIDNPGVPAWWPGFCAAYDVVAAGYLAWLLARRRVQARQ